MHRFQPTRASPPIRQHTLDTSVVTDLSQSTNVAVAPELQNLNSDDIEILDAVIKRAGPGATTFFTIFKAYSDVLNERGLDPQEVVYYGKLLKLGTMKGKSWGDKWEMVKAQFDPELLVTPTLGSFQSESGYHPQLMSESRFSDDQYSSVSQHVSNKHEKTYKSKPSVTQQLAPKLGAPKVPRVPEKKPAQKIFSLDAKEFPILASIAQRNGTPKQPSPLLLSDDEGASSSPIPPSYKSTALDSTLPLQPRSRIRKTEKPVVLTDAIRHNRQIPSIPKDKPKQPVDLDDAWKNIKMQQDEEFADKFRDDMLVARCWEMWRQGFLWITTTHQQIGEARDKLLLRLSMQKWQTKQAMRLIREDELVKQFDTCRTRLSFRIWQAKLKHKRQIAWRNDMRQKMKIMKDKSDARLLKSAWTLWWQLHLERRADTLYQSNLIVRYHTRWKEELVKLDEKYILAAQFSESIQFASVKACLRKWTQMMALRREERVMVQRVDRRIMTDSFDTWRKRMAIMKFADEFRDKMVLRHAIQKWKRSMLMLMVLEHRATKHLARQDDLLLRAIVRIWRARMRGKRLEEFNTTQALRNAWRIWKDRIVRHEADLALADKLFERNCSHVAGNALVRWHKILTTHRNANQYAAEFHAAHVRAKFLLLWRIRLRDANQCAKVARWANRFFDTRRAWKLWTAALEAKKVQERLEKWNASRLQKNFRVWQDKRRERQSLRQWDNRVKSHAINRWMKRVIYVKSRELDVAQQEDTSLMRSAFDKWKRSLQQHAEQVSLLENYLLLKQEGVLHRAFHHWLNAKREAEHRRLVHQRKEAQLRQLAITSAWEKWRERFKEIQLRPLEYEVILANQRSVMIHFFSVWRSKTKSLPALQFHSRHVKEKFFKKWRIVMPNALRMKKARETDRYNTLVRTFEKWQQAYKTKTTLKAVARAKYLRLPAAPSRPVVTKSRPLYAGSMFPRRPPDLEQDTESQAEDLPEPSKFPARTQFQSSRARSERSVGGSEYRSETRRPTSTTRTSYLARTEFMKPKPRTESVPRSDCAASAAREPSPVRSIASMPDRRSRSPYSSCISEATLQTNRAAGGGRLWLAMKDLPQRRSRNL
ncbi:hypothetical protein BDN70DRAFT_877988 [Pholiota conissans]|uniref:Sfi1 spindle body domain-containing protein n=1 Tax=Pholiota conissans TaxID=109636 RepID=A0A9P5Z3Q1_9AGAR|nr:hypothetical protein BDN70DRAFT_877988 [Pholiota conissans]